MEISGTLHRKPSEKASVTPLIQQGIDRSPELSRVYKRRSAPPLTLSGAAQWQAAELTGVPDAKISRQGRCKHMFTFDDLIYSYTTRDALNDGVLVKVDKDVSAEASITFPVYLTESVWDKYVKVPPGLEGMQDVQGRIWDILVSFAWVARVKKESNFLFKVTCQVPNHFAWEANEKKPGMKFQFREVTLKAVIAAQDINDPTFALFIMKPWED